MPRGVASPEARRRQLVPKVVSCLQTVGNTIPSGLFEEHFDSDDLSYADAVVAATSGQKKQKAKKPVSKKGIPAAAKGQRDGHVWIAAENDMALPRRAPMDRAP
eukprot:COSAG03_NODE_290_length_9343_cov_30.055820_6_plen_104_part_00